MPGLGAPAPPRAAAHACRAAAVGALGAAAIVGFDTHRSVAYQAFAFLAALLGAASLAARCFRARFTAQRTLPRLATVGVPLTYRVAVRNETARRQAGWELEEDLGDPRPTEEAFLVAAEPAGERFDWADRALGYARWAWLLARHRPAEVVRAPVPTLPPGAAVEIPVTLTPLRRGRLAFAGLVLVRPDPFGLVRARLRLPLGGALIVLPRRYPVPLLALPGGRRLQPGGVALAGSVGDAEEFVALREYRSGDPLRPVYWKGWARAGRPIVREYQDEFFVRRALVLDTFLPAEPSDVFEEAVSVAASFACAAGTHEGLLDLLFVGPDALGVTAGRGVGTVERMLEILACVRVCRHRPFRTLHGLVASRAAGLSACIVVLVAWDAERQAFLDHLRALGIPVLALLVTRPGAAERGLPPAVCRLEVGRVAEGLARL